MRDWMGRLLIVAGCLVAMLGGAYYATVQYLLMKEQASPSTSRVLVLRDGTRVPLVQPASGHSAETGPGALTFLARPTETECAERWSGPLNKRPTMQASPAGIAGAEHGNPSQILPPVRIKLPSIHADWPVVLTNGTMLPKYRAVGWLLGSAFPGAPGNLVLSGHLDGPYATFGQLKSLHTGDIFYVYTEAAGYRYRVRNAFETTPDDILVMAPTGTATATLITCSGEWDSLDQMYDHRWIVAADFVGFVVIEDGG